MNGKRKRERKKKTEDGQSASNARATGLSVRLLRFEYVRCTQSRVFLSFCSSRPWPSHLATRSLRAEQWTVSIYLASLKRVSALGSSTALSLSLSIPYVALISTETWATKLPIATRSEFSSYEDLVSTIHGWILLGFLARQPKGVKIVDKNLATKKFRKNGQPRGILFLVWHNCQLSLNRAKAPSINKRSIERTNQKMFRNRNFGYTL